MESIKKAIEHYCSYQERCHSETLDKLYKLGADSEVANNLLAELISDNFINEERFATAYATGKFNMLRWGRIKIKQGLVFKKVSNYNIQKALECIDENEYCKVISELINKKDRELKGVKPERLKQAKIVNYLRQKGFELNLIAKSMNNKQ